MSFPVVEITWLDHVAFGDAMTLDELKAKKLASIVTVGYLIHKTPREYFVAQERHDDGMFRDTTLIDRKCVKEFRWVRR